MNKLTKTNRTNEGYDQGAALVVALRRILEFVVSFVNGAIAEAKR
tara:strand:- start:719 stop:853 length:135 start_codon:yes stop_codon:yes gene_type:complete